ncbi:MAG: hypothetical protein QM749_07410 [Aquabacterium sp.]
MSQLLTSRHTAARVSQVQLLELVLTEFELIAASAMRCRGGEPAASTSLTSVASSRASSAHEVFGLAASAASQVDGDGPRQGSWGLTAKDLRTTAMALSVSFAEQPSALAAQASAEFERRLAPALRLSRRRWPEPPSCSSSG